MNVGGSEETTSRQAKLYDHYQFISAAACMKVEHGLLTLSFTDICQTLPAVAWSCCNSCVRRKRHVSNGSVSVELVQSRTGIFVHSERKRNKKPDGWQRVLSVKRGPEVGSQEGSAPWVPWSFLWRFMS